METFEGKRVLVTGVCGTVGRALLATLTEQGREPDRVVGLDNDESGLFYLDQHYRQQDRVHLFVGDVRDPLTLRRHFRDIDVVVHAAALKHVELSERAPFEVVQSNILGVQNVIEAADATGVARVLFTSSDKAVNPTNVMGTSKLMGERLMTAANARLGGSATVFASTRFGNVLGSSGSVIPLFIRQIQQGGPVTLTEPGMTRFIMTVKEAARLVLDSIWQANGGEVFVTKMPAIRILDLAQVMIRKLAPICGHDPDNVEIEVIGAKPGEKLYEELMSDEETRRSVELSRYFAVLPAFRSVYGGIDYSFEDLMSDKVTDAYHSGRIRCLAQNELETFLDRHNLLDVEALPGRQP